MATLFLARDGVTLTDTLIFTTNRRFITLQGKADPSTVVMQVSINGGAYNSSMIDFTGENFTVPGPLYPDGLPLSPGINTVKVRSVNILGVVSPPITAQINMVITLAVASEQIPTGLRIERKRDRVTVYAARPQQSYSAQGTPLPYTFRGFNLYAATTPGGPYYLVNPEIITEIATEEKEDITHVAKHSTIYAQSSDPKLLRILVTEVDEFDHELERHVDDHVDISYYRDKLRFSSTVEAVSQLQFLTYTHNRIQGSLHESEFSTVGSTEPLYYVMTALFFDPETSEEIETPYSQEIPGSPLILDTTIRDLPGRTALQIQTDYIREILRANPEISLIPGSTTRDVSIDPFSSEMERVWFLLDFVHRSQSFLTLLPIDDANGDGESDPVVTSAYKQALKQALGFTSDASVQSLINQQFDKLAINVGESRQAGRFSQGQVVFYTTVKPTTDKVIASGTLVTAPSDASINVVSNRFRVGGTYVMMAKFADSYYNFDRKRYEILCDITSEQPGASTNVPAGAIKTASGVSGLSVTNLEATLFGRDAESNADLASRCILKPSSIDSGTEGGYTLEALRHLGVLRAKVVKSGDTLMMRDYDDVRHKHIGGKVDIWVQGVRERQVSETFSFSFEIARDISCSIVNLATLTFRVLDPRVTPNTPIVEILDNLSQGLGVRNATLGLDYDLNGVQILDYQTFRINTAIPQPVTSNDDVILADYRFRSVNKFYPKFQPVRRIVSVQGENSGSLTTDGYRLYRTEDPLLHGESTIAKDYIEILQVNGIPTGIPIVVTDEQHVLIGNTEEPLLKVGINLATIKVWNKTRTALFVGPNNPTPDYLVIAGTQTTPARIVRAPNSNIQNGETVSVDYSYDENFVVNYVINDLLQVVQRAVDDMKHATADVIVKQAIDNPIVVEISVQLKAGAKKEIVDPLVRTSVSQEFNRKRIGQDTYQSDVIRGVDASDGVDYVVVPFATMAYQNGCRRLRENLGTSALLIPSLSQGGNLAYILTSPLSCPTTDGGGLITEHRGVFENDEPFTLSSTLLTLTLYPRQAFILGAQGASILGYSDDATLILGGFTTQEEIQAERLRRTANRVFLSKTTPPNGEVYTVSYVVRGDHGAKDIISADVDFNSLGELTISYRTET